MRQARLFVNGKWLEGAETFQVVNPANGQPVAEAHLADASLLDQAVQAAHNAFHGWSGTVARKRSQYLNRVKELLLERKNEIAETLSLEQGKPLSEAVGEIIYSAEFFGWFAEECKRLGGKLIPANRAGQELRVEPVPVGVVLAITPWNFPAGMIARKLAPALAAGCTVVAKPASQTPLTAVKFFEIFEEIGLPAGVANLVLGSGSTVGNQLLRDPRVRKVTFTGSTEVGSQIMRLASERIVKVSLELGGHAPFVVMEDADLAKTVGDLVRIKLRNAGQTCISPNRIFVHETVHDRFLELLTERVAALKIGPYFDKEAAVGPLIDSKAVSRVLGHIDDAVRQGARLVYGGKKCTEPGLEGGHFMQPAILTGVTREMKIFREETFGPVFPIISYRYSDEMIGLANDSRYGLAAYVYGKDYKLLRNIVEKLEYATISVNEISISDLSQAPVGGIKESGIGREGGREGIEQFTEIKCILTDYS